MIGKSINGYTIIHEIPGGGMADVYYAKNRLGKEAAIKILKLHFSQEPKLRERMEAEAEIIVKIDHPNIRQVYDLTEIDGRPIIVMEYLHGQTLKEYIENGKLTNEEIKDYFQQVVVGLQEAHDKGIVHRDIKPSNIFITKDKVAKILDFGIAKIEEDAGKTQTGTTLGTLIYMSPEQVKDPKRVDYRSDIYSLGVTFYHFLTRKAPYDTTTDSQFTIQTKIVNEDIDLKEVPEEWQRLLANMLIKEKDMRKISLEFQTQGNLTKLADVTIIDEVSKIDKKPQSLSGSKVNNIRKLLTLAIGIIAITMGTYYFYNSYFKSSPENNENIEVLTASYKTNEYSISYPETLKLDTINKNYKFRLLFPENYGFTPNINLMIKLSKKSISLAEYIKDVENQINKQIINGHIEISKQLNDTCHQIIWSGKVDGQMLRFVQNYRTLSDTSFYALTYSELKNKGTFNYLTVNKILNSFTINERVIKNDNHQKMQEMKWRFVLEKNTIETYEDFIKNNPESKYISEGIKRINVIKLFKSMIVVKGGIFDQGCPNGHEVCWVPYPTVKKVKLNDFRISKYEVTQELWSAIMGNNPSHFRNCDKCPVENVSWNDIQKFIKELNNISKLQYRLPSSDEWEYAARGGNKSKNFNFAGSNNVDDVGWVRDLNRTYKVGLKKANELGIYDMNGNVWEWTSDDCSNSHDSDCIVIRGDSWATEVLCTCSENSGGRSKSAKLSNGGFRLVLTI